MIFIIFGDEDEKTLFVIFILFFSANLFADEIYLKNKKVIKGKIIKVTRQRIEFDPVGSTPFDVIGRSKVIKIVYDNGKQVIFNEKALKKMNDKKNSRKQMEEYKTNSNNSFRKSYLHIGLVGAIGFFGGKLADKEYSLYNDYKNGHYNEEYNAFYFGGFEFDLMLPGTYSDTRLGVKCRYLYASGDQNEEYGNLFTYENMQIGPVWNTIMLENSSRTGVIQYYALYGKIYNGELTAMPWLRGKGLVVMDESQYKTLFDGYTLSFGIGVRSIYEFSLPVSLAVGLNYTYAKLEFDKVLPVYNSDHISFYSFCLEFLLVFVFKVKRRY